jgi:dihydrofolate synthase/folylpolyglutamate synthase
MTTSDELLERLRGLHPQLIDLSLGRIEKLLAKLGHPERRLPPVVHIAGTNGKGSVCAYLKAMLEAAGQRVGVYTSPHLVRFHERIALPGKGDRAAPIEDGRLVDVLSRVEAANAGEPMTFFEMTTAAAFLAFAEASIDALVLEVGLGGRLDATNVVARPAVTVITALSMDHMHFLGDTLEKIAAEKAGILKRGVPCVVARQDERAMAVIREEARRSGAPLLVAGEHFDAFEQNRRLIVQEEEALHDLPLPSLIGAHQVANAGLAVVAAHLLRKHVPIGDEAIARGLTEARWPARMQRLSNGPLGRGLPAGTELWLDGAHNPGGAQAIASTLADLEERAPKPLYLITGVLKQKDAAGFFAPFRGLACHVVTVPIPGDPNALDPAQVAAAARSAGLTAEPARSVAEAIARVEAHAEGPARILICGSLHLAGHVLALEEGLEAQRN